MKIAILGTENSHAYAFANLIKNSPKYKDVEIVGVYGYDDAANKKLVDDGLVKYVGADPHEFLGKVDGIMVTARHGDHHNEYALPYVKAGIPAFIDKPFTVGLDKAAELLDAAKENGALLCGGSSLKYLDEMNPLARFRQAKTVVGGNVTAPINMVNPYGGFYFYAQHLVEIMTTIFGRSLTQIHADRRDKEVTFTARYDSFNVNATFIEGIGYYTASVYGSKESRSEILRFTPQSFRHEMNDMLALLNGKEMKQSYESFITPVFIINAIMRSMESGKWEDINEIKI